MRVITNRRIERQSIQRAMLYPKTLKSINGLKTHKLIREEMMKQDFFDNLLKHLKLELQEEQHDFLLNYVLSEKYQSKEEKITVNTQINIAAGQKQNCSHLNLIDTGLYQTKRKTPEKRNLTSCTAVRVRQQIPKNKTFQNDICDKPSDISFHRSSLIRYDSQGQYKAKSKFHKISRKNRNTYRSTRAPNKDSSISGLSGDYLRKNYKQNFIKDIFQRYTFQQKSLTADQEFKDTYSFINAEEIRQQQLRQQAKYKNLTSIQFARSPRSRFRCKVNTRKF